MAFVFNPFTGNLDVAEQVTFSPPLVDLTPYEKKVDSEQRDQDLQDQIDDIESNPSMPEPPDDGVVYGRKTESGTSSWEIVSVGPGGGNTVWTAKAGEDNPTAADGVQLNDLLYRPAEDELFIWRVFDVTGALTWMQMLAGSSDVSALEARVTTLESELATLKAQMAKVLQAGDKIVGAMTTPDSGPEDTAFSGNIEIQL